MFSQGGNGRDQIFRPSFTTTAKSEESIIAFFCSFCCISGRGKEVGGSAASMFVEVGGGGVVCSGHGQELERRQ